MNKSISHSAGVIPCALRGLIVSAAASASIASLCAFAALSMPNPGKYTGTFAIAAIFIAAFSGGFAAAKKRGGLALPCGALSAVFFIALISLLALAFSVKINISFFALRALGVLLCSVLGATIGAGAGTVGKKKRLHRKNRA